MNSQTFAEHVIALRRDRSLDTSDLPEALEKSLGLTSSDVLGLLASVFDQRPFSSAELRAMEPAFDVVPFTEAATRECFPFRDNGEVWLVISDPFDERLRLWAERRIVGNYRWGLALVADLRALLKRHEELIRAVDSFHANHGGVGDSSDDTESLSLRSISEHDSPVIKLVHSTLYDGLKAGASDIHIETTTNGVVIKYRIDGVLGPVSTLPGTEFGEQVISRIKVMAELDIAERRIPQDGRFKVVINDHPVDFRVSIMPSVFGEDAVIRILDRRAISDQISGLTLESLGFDTETAVSLRRLAEEPYGMFLVTGPTGSGKTTTLYAVLTEINKGRDKIVTIEDPVEYQLPGILQIPVNERKGLTFSRGLRSILRHDPDRIMVGEIRDHDTAQIAVQSALTGHLVFTTVHANSVFDVIGRFLNMEVDPYSFVSAVNGIVAQRLVRLTCAHCAEAIVPEASLLARSRIPEERIADYSFLAGAGCGQCRGTGYRGRQAIAEVLILDDELRELVVERAPARRIKQLASEKGTRFLREAALNLVRDGKTTLEEINRVTLAV